MKYNKIYLGTWMLGSTIHLKEFYQAMAFQKSEYFKPKEIRGWQKGIKPKAINYITEAINIVNGKFEKNISFDMLEDGLFIISKKLKKPKEDHKQLDQLTDKKIQPFLQNLFSKDVALPKIFSESKISNPTIIHVSKAGEKNLEKIFTDFDEIVNKKIEMERGDVWIGKNLAVLNTDKLHKQDLDEAIRYLMFARVYELQLKEALHIQRTLWSQIKKIGEHTYYKNSELPIIRDKALLIQSRATFFKSRSKQMSQFLLWREKLIDDYLSDHILSNIFREFFLSLKSTQYYLHELWEMTSTYADATVESISLLYSDTQQKELQTLQKLFLVSAVVSILSLGTIAGSKMITTNLQGQIISKTTITSWHINSLLIYGAIVFLISIVIYYSFYLIFGKFQQVKKSQKERNWIKKN